jgi:hypothetical protein
MKKATILLVGSMLMGVFVSMGCKGDPEKPIENTHEAFTAPANALMADETTPPREAVADAVYICKSTGAKKYHYDQYCTGLKRCTHTVEKTTKKAAEALGLGLCGYED